MKKPGFLTRRKKNKKKKQLKDKDRRLFRSGRAAVLCAVVLAALCVLPVFVNNILGYLPITAAVLAIAVSYIYLVVLRRSISFEEISDLNGGTRGREVEMKVRLSNRSMLFCPEIRVFFYVADLFGNTDAVTTKVITFPPKGEREFSFAVSFDHIGVYSAGLKKIELGDLLGLFVKTVKNDNRHEVTIIPRIADIEHLEISRTAVTQSEKMTVVTQTDSSDYAGVRDYVAGDPIKSIHWKISARMENYVTRVFESYTNTGIAVIMDMLSPEYDREQLMSIFDTVIETAFSAGTYARKSGIDSEILYFDHDREKKKITDYEPEGFPAIMRDIPRIYTEKQRKNGGDLLQEECNSMYSMGNIAICTANVTNEIVESLLEIKNRKKNPILFAVIPPDLSADEKAMRLRAMWRLDDARITSYIISAADQLSGDEEEGARYA